MPFIPAMLGAPEPRLVRHVIPRSPHTSPDPYDSFGLSQPRLLFDDFPPFCVVLQSCPSAGDGITGPGSPESESLDFYTLGGYGDTERGWGGGRPSIYILNSVYTQVQWPAW